MSYPITISFSLLKDLSKLSVCRTLQHQLIKSISFDGHVLDIGGGDLTSYRNFLGSSFYTSVNIDPCRNPSVLVAPSDSSYPCLSSSFDHCLLFNLLEHLHSWDVVLSESFRLLACDGALHILVPFIYPIHPSPRDFIRPTYDYLNDRLSSAGFSDISIHPISPGPLSMSYMFLIPIPIPFLHRSFKVFFFLCDRLLALLFPRKIANYTRHSPFFYYVSARK